MITTESRLVNLACVTCGSNVDVSRPMNRFVCEHCGTLQVVERSRGAVNLRRYADITINALHSNVKSQRETKRSQLANELQIAESKRSQKQRHWRAIRSKRLTEWKTKLKTTKSKVKSITRTSLIISVMPSALIAAAAYGIGKHQWAPDIAAIVAFVTFLVCSTVTIWIVREFLKNSESYGLVRLKQECWKEFVQMDARIAAEMEELEKQILALHVQLKGLDRSADVKICSPEG
jgi:predicted RNA-binding Zn-ribbon protein involved in translation (DUF1610 family)